MKKIIFFGAVFMFGLSINIVSAIYLPFGGRLVTTPTPGVVCPAGKELSPFTLVPSLGPAGLMVGDYHYITQNYRLAPSAWILGLYIPVPIPECETTSAPPVPVTGYRTFLFGESQWTSISD